jgi:hypothetical protein
MKRLCVVAALGALALLVLHHYTPLQPASVAAWAGIVLALMGFSGLIRPWFGPRWAAAATLLGALALGAFALSWPVAPHHVASASTLLDSVMPDFDFDEHHEVLIQAPPERVMAEVRASTFNDIGAMDTLMRLRALAFGRRLPARRANPPALTAMTRPGAGFVYLADTPTEIVLGMAGQPWANQNAANVRDAASWRAFHDPRSIRVAFNLRATPAPGGTLLTTDTRIEATDAGARRLMARYWRLVYPGSGIIRHMWLDAIAARALTPAAPRQP